MKKQLHTDNLEIRGLVLDQLVLNQQGVALLTVLMVLSLLTVIGMAMIGVSNTEVRIAGNQHAAVANFFDSESVAVEGCAAIEDASVNDLKLHTPVWLTWPGDSPAWNFRDPTLWNWDPGTGSDNTRLSERDTLGETVQKAFVAHEDGIAGGTSLDMTKPQLRAFAVLGLYDRNIRNIDRTRKLLEVGYLRRF